MPSIIWSLISFHFIKAVIHLFSHALHYRTSIKTLGKLMTVKYNPPFISCNKALKCYILIPYCLIYWRISFKGKCVYTHMRTHMPLSDKYSLISDYHNQVDDIRFTAAKQSISLQSKTCLKRTPKGPENFSALERCQPYRSSVRFVWCGHVEGSVNIDTLQTSSR